MVSSNAQSVGAELAAVLPNDSIPWYRKPHLLQLNFSILSIVFFSAANGYDGSMMNGLQSLDQWQTFMNYPTGAWLGFINAAPSLGAFFVYSIAAWIYSHYWRKWGIALGYFWLLLGVGIQTGITSPAMFVICRLFVGGVGACF
jgi:hypothetical protein